MLSPDNTAIRPLADTDCTAWQLLFNDYATFYNVTIPAGAHSRVWNWIFDDDNPFWCDVIELNGNGDNQGELIGFVQYQLMHRSLAGEMVCYLSDLYVKPEHRSTRAGKALIDHVISVAREKGVSNVRWLTQESNDRARKLYDHYCPKSDFILYSYPVPG